MRKFAYTLLVKTYTLTFRLGLITLRSKVIPLIFNRKTKLIIIIIQFVRLLAKMTDFEYAGKDTFFPAHSSP